MTSLVISDLNNNSTYACSVAAETAEGVGPFSHVIFIGRETNMTGDLSGELYICVYCIYFLASEPQTTSLPTEKSYLYPVISAIGSVIILVIVIIVSIIICTKCKQRKRKHWYENNYT